MPEIQSPCLSCRLKNYSKDNPTCRDCKARCDYIKIIDGATIAVSTKSIKKRASMTNLEQAELYLQAVCEKYLIKIEDLRGRQRSSGLGDIRKEVIHTLYSKYKLMQSEIGKLLTRSNQSISIMMKPKVIKSAKTVDETQTFNIDLEEAGIAHTLPPDAGDPVSVGRTTSKPDQTVEEPEPDNKIFIIINFKDHPGIYEYLIKTAKTNFRKPKDHILYLVSEEREGTCGAKKKIFSRALNYLKIYLMAFCFTSGILIAGAESIWWPWHIPIGIALVGASCIMANVWENDPG